jgi:hypothetical protein
MVRSRSAQFVVRGVPVSELLAPPAFSKQDQGYVHLDPMVAAVSCERIKDALLQELGVEDLWRGTIYVVLHPVQRDAEPIRVTSLRFNDGWSYRLNMPDVVDKERFVRAVVQALLQEMVNRTAGERPTELPHWLVHGLAAQLQAPGVAPLALEPATWSLLTERDPDPLQAVRERLRGRAPLSFTELSWPGDEQLAGPLLQVYQGSAHLFVNELLRLPRGRQCLGRMIRFLPEHLNWELAFLRAFQPHFARLADADKWWALVLVRFIQQDQNAAWPAFQAWQKLEDILLTPVQVRLDSKELPMSTAMKLQRLLAEWPSDRQVPMLLEKVNYLQALRLRAAPEVARMVDAYAEVLGAYLMKRSQNERQTQPKTAPRSLKLLVNDTVKRLDALDEQRELARRRSDPAMVSKGQAGP